MQTSALCSGSGSAEGCAQFSCSPNTAATAAQPAPSPSTQAQVNQLHTHLTKTVLFTVRRHAKVGFTENIVINRTDIREAQQ